MTATVEGARNVGTMVLVRIGKDPFPTYVEHSQLERIGKWKGKPSKERTVAKAKTATPLTRELRQKARDLGISDWEILDRDGLLAAVTEAEDGIVPDPDEVDTDTDDEAADEENDDESEDDESEDDTEQEPEVATTTRTKKRASSKKAPARKATTKKRTPTSSKRAAPRPPTQPDGPNPFRPGSNLYLITEELMKGGKRSTLVKRLVPKLEYKPRTKDPRKFDAELETDRRLKIVGYLLRQSYGFEYTHGGHGGPERGPDAYIQVIPPA